MARLAKRFKLLLVQTFIAAASSVFMVRVAYIDHERPLMRCSEIKTLSYSEASHGRHGHLHLLPRGSCKGLRTLAVPHEPHASTTKRLVPVTLTWYNSAAILSATIKQVIQWCCLRL